MKSLSRVSGFSRADGDREPQPPPAGERLLEQVVPLGEPEQVPHPAVGGELRLVGQHLRAAEHHRAGLGGEIEDLLPLRDEDVEQLGLARSAPPASRSRSPRVSRMRSRLSPASRSLRIRATSCTAAGADPGRHLDEDGADHATPEVEHQQEPLAGDRHQLQPLQHQLVQRRRHRHAQLLGQHAEHLGGPAHDLLHRVARAGQLAAQGLPRLVGRRRQAHDRVDVDPVRAVGRDPAGGGVGVEEKPLVLQVAHRAADGGGRDAKPEPPGNGLAPGRLRGLDVGLDDRLEDPELPLAQLVRGWHRAEFS